MSFLLFKEDWLQYPTAIVDYKTTNQSFLKLVYIYKQMGVRNCEFPLALLQPELQGVDPYNPNLSDEIKFKIALEAKYNPWYYIRELSMIPPNAGNVPIRFKANRGNIAMYWCFFNHIDFALVQLRQTGKSVSTDVLMIGVNFLWASNTSISLITKDVPLRNNNIQRLKEMRDLLPDYIYSSSRLDADNNEMITNVFLGNKYTTAVGRNDKAAADKLGRGLTVPICHFDEMAYISLIGTSLPVALSSGSAARDEAKAGDQPYGNIYTTTAGNINSRDGQAAYKFMTGGAPWNESFFDLPNRETLEKLVDRNSTGLKPLVYAVFNHRQLGYTDEWLYQKLRESASSGEIADRDYMNIWTVGTEGSPLTQEEKRIINSGVIEVTHMELTDSGYMLRWYIPEHEIMRRMESSHFVLGNDTSDALGGDNDSIGLVLLDAYSHDVIFTGRFNETNINQFALFIVDLLVRYPNITYIPERRSSGASILDVLFIQLPRRGIDPFRRIYNRIVDNPEENDEVLREIKRGLASRQSYFYDRYKREFGFATSGSGQHSRDSLYNDSLKSVLRHGGKRLHDRTLVDEMLGLMIKNGRIDHGGSNHDDMVISLLLAHWLCIKGRNLSFYGIDPKRIFSVQPERDEALTMEDVYKEKAKQQALVEFNQLMGELKLTKDPIVTSKIEMRLKQLSRMYSFTDEVGVGIDAMINKAKEEKSRKAIMGRFQNRYQDIAQKLRVINQPYRR